MIIFYDKLEFEIHLYTFHYNIAVIISEFLLRRKTPHQPNDITRSKHYCPFLTGVKTQAIKCNACVKNLLFLLLIFSKLR